MSPVGMIPVENVEQYNTRFCLDMRNHGILKKHAKDCKTVGWGFAEAGGNSVSSTGLATERGGGPEARGRHWLHRDWEDSLC